MRASLLVAALGMLLCGVIAEGQSMRHRLAFLEAREQELAAQIRASKTHTDGQSSESSKRELATRDLSGVRVVLRGLPSKGAASARLVIVEYGDFQCPFCRRYHAETFPDIDRQYVSTGRLRYAFQQMPLQKTHTLALTAASAATCAQAQGKFWEMQAWLYSNPLAVRGPGLLAPGSPLHLDHVALGRCMQGPGLAEVTRQAASAAALGITSTPTFLLGEVDDQGDAVMWRRIAGAQPYHVFQDAIDDMLLRPDTKARSQ